MLGKRLKRIYHDEKSAKESPKEGCLFSMNPEHSLTQTTNLSLLNTPDANLKSESDDSKRNENSSPTPSLSKKELVLEMVSLLIDEFNCNH